MPVLCLLTDLDYSVPIRLLRNKLEDFYAYRTVVLNRGSVELQGFDEVVSRVRWTLSDILTYYI